MSATSVSLQPQEISEDLHIFAISEEGTNTEQQQHNGQETFYFPIAQRDPNHVRTILRLAVSALGFALLSLVLAALLTYKLIRSPALVVVERTSEGDRVVGDDRQYTLTGAVQYALTAPATVTRSMRPPNGLKPFSRLIRKPAGLTSFVV